MNNYEYFEHRQCEYFPCHDSDELNCLFCFCPLFHLKDCGGDYIINKKGIKDCHWCSFPHLRCNYQHIIDILSKQSTEGVIND